MRIVTSALLLLLCSSFSVAAERCFDAYAAEQNRTGLSYQSIIRQGNIARELTFKADSSILSVLVFNQNISVKVLKTRFADGKYEV